MQRGGDRVALHRYGSSGPMVLLLPAMGVDASYYAPFAEALAVEGTRCAVMDWRGHGDSTPPVSRASRYGYRELVSDVDVAVQHLGGGVTVVGHSLGGQVGLLAASGTGGIAKVVLIASGLPHFSGYRGVTRFALLPYSQAIGAVSRVLGVWPGWTFGGRQSAGVMRDWAYTARHGRLPGMGGAERAQAMASLAIPVLAVHIEGDTMTPKATTQRLLRSVPKASIMHIDYTETTAGGPIDHIKWVRRPRALARQIATFAASG